jgi:hypothetical protein
MTWRAYGRALAVVVGQHCATPDIYRASQWPLWVRMGAESARKDRRERDFYAGIRDVLHTVTGQPLDA